MPPRKRNDTQDHVFPDSRAKSRARSLQTVAFLNAFHMPRSMRLHMALSC